MKIFKYLLLLTAVSLNLTSYAASAEVSAVDPAVKASVASRYAEIEAMIKGREIRWSGRPLTQLEISMMITGCREVARAYHEAPPEAGSALGPAPKLERVVLNNTNLEHEHLSQLLSVLMIAGAPIIDLSNNNLDDRSIHRIVCLLGGETLKELNLAGNKFSPETKAWFEFRNGIGKATAKLTL